MPEYYIAQTEQDYNDASLLFREYAAWLQIDLCFQDFGSELNKLPQMYGLPGGAIFLCKQNDQLAGCVAVRRFNDTTAELKRMWVRNDFRSLGIGETLLKQGLEFATAAGYASIVLDTLASMTSAIKLYKKYGFEETEAYYHNPHSEARYFSKQL